MTCEELMKTDVEAVGLRDSAQHAARKMRDMNIGFIPVIDDQRHVLGTLTDRDIAVRLVADMRPGNTGVKEIMTREVVFCRPTDDIDRAVQIMTDRKKSRLMVLDREDRLVGVISLSDVVEVLDAVRAGQALQAIASREVYA